MIGCNVRWYQERATAVFTHQRILLVSSSIAVNSCKTQRCHTDNSRPVSSCILDIYLESVKYWLEIFQYGGIIILCVLEKATVSFTGDPLDKNMPCSHPHVA